MTLMILTSALALGTAVVGWWSVPVLGLAYGVWTGERRAGATAGISAFLAWSALMLWNWFEGPLAELSESLGAVMGLPGWTLLIVTVLFPTVLAWTAAGVGTAIRRT